MKRRSSRDSIYRKVLEQVFSEGGLDIPVNPKILVVACGELREGPILSKFFDTQDIYALDKDPSILRIARKKNHQIPEEQIRFGDARSVTDYFHRKFDIITLRHPNPTESIQI